jgi:hypothetical protein
VRQEQRQEARVELGEAAECVAERLREEGEAGFGVRSGDGEGLEADDGL